MYSWDKCISKGNISEIICTFHIEECYTYIHIALFFGTYIYLLFCDFISKVFTF